MAATNADQLEPLSQRARRLLAPGAARSPDALRQQLLARVAGDRKQTNS
ncbi:hypothetical protein [Roseateles sp.]